MEILNFLFLPKGVAKPTVLVCGNFANITKIRTLIVPIKNNRKSINQLKNTSSAITTVISNSTTKIKDEKNNFSTSFGFLFEMGTPLIS